MRIRTSELTGTALDWAVAKCVEQARGLPDGFLSDAARRENFQPSVNWLDGGPIIEREGIEILCNVSEAMAAHFKDAHADWFACRYPTRAHHWHATTPLVAAMRCYVASKLGEEVNIPEELV